MRCRYLFAGINTNLHCAATLHEKKELISSKGTAFAAVPPFLTHRTRAHFMEQGPLTGRPENAACRRALTLPGSLGPACCAAAPRFNTVDRITPILPASVLGVKGRVQVSPAPGVDTRAPYRLK